MDLDEKIAALQSVPIFRQVGKADLERVARLAVERNYSAGSEVVSQGEPGAALFIITSGSAQAVRSSDGKEVVLAELGPGSFFGEMALFDGYPRSATVRASTDLECLAATQWDVLAELRNTPGFAVEMLKVVARRLREADGELASLKGSGEPPID